MSETKLKPCPFCGREAYKRLAFPVDADGMEMNMYIVGCEHCDISFSFLWDEECAVELWNTRQPINDVLEELKEIDKKTFKMSPKDAIDIIEKVVSGK